MKSSYPVVLAFIGFLLMTTCSPQRYVQYPLPNPVLVAFTHEIDFEVWKDSIQNQSSIPVKIVDNGLLFYSDILSEVDQVWMNDSLMVFRQNSSCHLPLLGIGDQVIFEAQRRESRAMLIAQVQSAFSQNDSLRLVDLNVNSCDIDSNEQDCYSLPIEGNQLNPVDSLTWQTSTFLNKSTYRFRNGYLHGPFVTLDSTGLLQKGQYEYGSEMGVWEYFNSSERLQYREEYAEDGEIQSVSYEKGATYTRADPLPTLQYLRRIHWLMFGLLCLLTVGVLIRYARALLKFKSPYQGQSTGTFILFALVMSPVLALAAGIITLFSIVFLSQGLGQLIGWDLPLHFLDILQKVLLFPIFVCFWLWITRRPQDAFWHSGIVVLVVLLLGEWRFLMRLEPFF